MVESAMRCPFCSSRDTRVIDKRDAEDVAMTRRRRECQQCNARFTTYERPEMSTLMIVKKDGRRQPFNRDKLRASIQTACTKRLRQRRMFGLPRRAKPWLRLHFRTIFGCMISWRA